MYWILLLKLGYKVPSQNGFLWSKIYLLAIGEVCAIGISKEISVAGRLVDLFDPYATCYPMVCMFLLSLCESGGVNIRK